MTQAEFKKRVQNIFKQQEKLLTQRNRKSSGGSGIYDRYELQWLDCLEKFGRKKPQRNRSDSLVYGTLYSQNLRFAADNMGGFTLFAIWRFGPCFLQADVNGGVDDAGGGHDRAREKDEFRLVKNALGLRFRFIGHLTDPIHRSA